jgi:hypothetical protein
LIFGYPNSMVEPSSDGTLVEARPILLRTHRYYGETSASRPKHDDVDLFLAYGDKAFDREGKEVDTPTLPGISGTPVWAVKPSDSTIWLPESCLHVVAVDSAYTKPGSRNRFIVTKVWTSILKAFKQVDAEAAREIHEAIFL